MIGSTHYVAGFLFNESASFVALIAKRKPEWQAGKLNGIGGHIEPGETPEDAMIREFREEAGIEIKNWRYFCRLADRRAAWTVHFFTARTPGCGIPLLPIECEEGNISLFLTREIHRHRVIDNLRWLIPLALDPTAPFAAVIDNLPGE